jgi:ribosomal protein S18 acetylase RimI-like enzyme
VQDLDGLARLAGALVRMHHEFDPQRFFLPEQVEEGYRGWFERELRDDRAILLAATLDDGLVGYVYGRIEERDWNLLLERHAALHDLWVEEPARRRGIAEGLVEAFAEEAQRRGAPRVVLTTAASNARAQEVFERLGFRRTMVEMTRELSGPGR